MDTPIVTVSERGQITIPRKIRLQLPVEHFVCKVENGRIVLDPLQSREDFFAEIEEAENDWEKNGGLSLNEMRKKFNL